MKAIYSQTKPSIQLWTDFGRKEYDLYLGHGNNTYGIKFVSTLRTFEPPNFNYTKKFQEEVEFLESSGKTSAMFSILAGLEDTWFEGDKIKARFLMPGNINQTWTFNLDSQEQDFNGKIGIELRCLIKKLEVIHTRVDRQIGQS